MTGMVAIAKHFSSALISAHQMMTLVVVAISAAPVCRSQSVFSCLASYGSLQTNAFVIAIVGCPENLIDAGMELGV